MHLKQLALLGVVVVAVAASTGCMFQSNGTSGTSNDEEHQPVDAGAGARATPGLEAAFVIVALAVPAALVARRRL